MFKKKVVTSFLIALAALAVSAQGGSKMGVVNADLVIQNSKKGKQFAEEFKAFNEKKRDELKAFFDEFEAKKKDIQQKAASMSEDKRMEAVTSLSKMETEMKRKQEDAKRESDIMLNDALNRMGKEIVPLIRQVAEEQGLDVILNHGQDSPLLYFSDKVNITKAVIDKYDALGN